MADEHLCESCEEIKRDPRPNPESPPQPCAAPDLYGAPHVRVNVEKPRVLKA